MAMAMATAMASLVKRWIEAGYSFAAAMAFVSSPAKTVKCRHLGCHSDKEKYELCRLHCNKSPTNGCACHVGVRKTNDMSHEFLFQFRLKQTTPY